MTRRLESILLAGCLLAGCLLPGAAEAVIEPLTVRIEDATAVPGGVLAVVLRTYSPRGVGQGQVCLTSQSPGAFGPLPGPLVELLEARVYSDAGDAVLDADFNAQSQELTLDFSSPSATVNRTDGPMVALLFRVDDQLPPGTDFRLELDPATQLFDRSGQPIDLDLRPGDMDIRSPAAPFELDAEGADAAPGEWAEAGVTSHESLPLGGGTVVFLYDPAVVEGQPEVSMSARFGTSTINVELEPGRIVVDFSSPELDLNRVPGQLVTVRLPIAAGAEIGTTSIVTLESGTTTLLDAAGLPLTLELGEDHLEFVPLAETAMFADGFEDGDVAGWCFSSP